MVKLTQKLKSAYGKYLDFQDVSSIVWCMQKDMFSKKSVFEQDTYGEYIFVLMKKAYYDLAYALKNYEYDDTFELVSIPRNIEISEYGTIELDSYSSPHFKKAKGTYVFEGISIQFAFEMKRKREHRGYDFLLHDFVVTKTNEKRKLAKAKGNMDYFFIWNKFVSTELKEQIEELITQMREQNEKNDQQFAVEVEERQDEIKQKLNLL